MTRSGPRFLTRLRRRPAPPRRPKVLVVMLDTWVRPFLSVTPDADRTFFGSEPWPARANSTQRLGLVNLQALSSIDEAEIEIIDAGSVTPRLARGLVEDDIVVLNLVSSTRTRTFVAALLAHLEAHPPRARLVLGTEFSWEAEVERGTLSAEQLRWLQTHTTTLRHTAKTELNLYRGVECTKARILEFPLGLDETLLDPDVPFEARRRITLVLAPEGRANKRNSDSEDLAELLAAEPTLASFEVVTLRPPYTTLDFWTQLERSAFLVMTSATETFSYVAHDAMASGAVVLHPMGMFANRVSLERGERRGPAFVVDSYPRSGRRFDDTDDLLVQLRSLAQDPALWREESRRGRELVRDEHSVAAVATRWRGLFLGEDPAPSRLLVLDGANVASEDAARLARRERADVVLAVHDAGHLVPLPTFSRVDGDTVWLSDFLADRGSGHLVHAHHVDAHEVHRHLDETPAEESIDERIRFLQLLVRLYRVGVVVLHESCPEVVRQAFEQVTTASASAPWIRPVRAVEVGTAD